MEIKEIKGMRVKFSRGDSYKELAGGRDRKMQSDKEGCGQSELNGDGYMEIRRDKEGDAHGDLNGGRDRKMQSDKEEHGDSEVQVDSHIEEASLFQRMRGLPLTFLIKASELREEFLLRIRLLLLDERGDVPGWVLVVLMTTGLVTGIWTIAAPRIQALLRGSLDAMNNVR
jgi:hypothetical protein